MVSKQKNTYLALLLLIVIALTTQAVVLHFMKP